MLNGVSVHKSPQVPWSLAVVNSLAWYGQLLKNMHPSTGLQNWGSKTNSSNTHSVLTAIFPGEPGLACNSSNIDKFCEICIFTGIF